MAERSRFNFQVTEKDIEKAHVGDSYQCVVAQAVARQLPNAHHIDVDLQTIRWSDEDGRHVFLTPYEVAGYIVAFDAGEELHPFNFHLRNAVPAMQKKAKTRGAKAVKASRSKVSNEQRRQKDAEAVLADPSSPPEKVAAAYEVIAQAPGRLEQAKANHEDVKAAYKASGEVMSEQRVSETTRRAAPRVFKTKSRAYGQRILRVNQAEGRKHYAG
jgi:hypothetical protein